jgi:hypothetical protein
LRFELGNRYRKRLSARTEYEFGEFVVIADERRVDAVPFVFDELRNPRADRH